MQALARPSRSKAHTVAHQHGFTIVEVLVALVVLGVGLLGVAALYLDTLRGARSALYRQQAVGLAADLGDRLRADRLYCGNPVAFDTCAADWRNAVATRLPGGTATVASSVLQPAPAGFTQALVRYTVTLSWKEPGEDGDSSYVLDVEN